MPLHSPVDSLGNRGRPLFVAHSQRDCQFNDARMWSAKMPLQLAHCRLHALKYILSFQRADLGIDASVARARDGCCTGLLVASQTVLVCCAAHIRRRSGRRLGLNFARSSILRKNMVDVVLRWCSVDSIIRASLRSLAGGCLLGSRVRLSFCVCWLGRVHVLLRPLCRSWLSTVVLTNPLSQDNSGHGEGGNNDKKEMGV
ncbi:hypothetical protein BX661DRAFT_175585 [Kickxella alabastrina]|uniref:uncharacterized protein n=1 Tax=Kickxella alabastrina TaxID=61397 RepID=UPI002220E8B8|nr:uncharacterized protein BX661DRAFT_175551 [Kickxella alabastrina]XP_051395202.1 uncharacterized protein BX661DRAFT_175575 [Kickxella alabastrina]XP_051395206.1 uncharacterized protein BX661DRAFT_175585 [Kickxella alabastrina]KAI7834802.1 hypothetical protein BX661DRAFT_175551 [Kickxella alabastrina]KAI7834814.1 hypothetical protein BX661DRAFT_175575 [Kickxella alabastrina]KAI7834818.1 hypothetical protein BX661DRAFT_175585 [Kickxella alabastrina]